VYACVIVRECMRVYVCECIRACLCVGVWVYTCVDVSASALFAHGYSCDVMPAPLSLIACTAAVAVGKAPTKPSSLMVAVSAPVQQQQQQQQQVYQPTGASNPYQVCVVHAFPLQLCSSHFMLTLMFL